MKLRRIESGSKTKDETASNEMSPEEALIWYDKQLSKYPNDTGLLSDKATLLEDMGQEEDALRCYTLLVETNPNDYICWYKMGIFLEKKGYLDAALESYNEAIKIDPRFVDCWMKIGNLFITQNLYENAKECFNWVLEIKPDHKDAAYALAQIKENKKTTSISNHTPQGFNNKVVKEGNLHKTGKRRKRKMKKPKEIKPNQDGNFNESQNEPEPVLENLKPKGPTRITKDDKSDITLDQLVTNLEELHDLLTDRTDIKKAESMADSGGIGVEDHKENDREFDYGEFNKELYDLRDSIIQHTEKFTGKIPEDAFSQELQTNISTIEDSKWALESSHPKKENLEYPVYDDIIEKLDEITRSFADTDDNIDSLSVDSIEKGLDVLQRMLDQNDDDSEPFNGEDFAPLENEMALNQPATDDQRTLEFKEFEEALDIFTQSQDVSSQTLKYWEANKEIIPRCYEEEISLEDLIAKGRQHMKNRDYDKALACFDRVLEYDPQCLDAWGAKGDLMLQMSGKEFSLEKLVIQGRRHMEKMEYDQALGCFDRALELDPQCFDAWSAKGLALIEMEKKNKKGKTAS